MMIYMFSLYTDIHITSSSPNMTEQMTLQMRRDEQLKKKLISTKVGFFPKKKREFERLKTKIENLAKDMSKELILCFVSKENDHSPETECSTYHKGEWKTFETSDAAVRAAYEMKSDQTIATMKIKQVP